VVRPRLVCKHRDRGSCKWSCWIKPAWAGLWMVMLIKAGVHELGWTSESCFRERLIQSKSSMSTFWLNFGFNQLEEEVLWQVRRVQGSAWRRLEDCGLSDATGHVQTQLYYVVTGGLIAGSNWNSGLNVEAVAYWWFHIVLHEHQIYKLTYTEWCMLSRSLEVSSRIFHPILLWACDLSSWAYLRILALRHTL